MKDGHGLTYHRLHGRSVTTVEVTLHTVFCTLASHDGNTCYAEMMLMLGISLAAPASVSTSVESPVSGQKRKWTDMRESSSTQVLHQPENHGGGKKKKKQKKIQSISYLIYL